MEIFFIRHTKTAIPDGVCFGQLDAELGSNFAREAEEVEELIKEYTFDAVFSSPSRRCTALAKSLFHGALYEDSRLLDLHFGDWEGKKWEEIPEEEMAQWMENFLENTPPNGESYYEVHERIVSFLSDLVGEKYKKVAIVTHATVIRFALGKAIDIPLHRVFDVKIDFGSISTIRFSEQGFIVEYINC